MRLALPLASLLIAAAPCLCQETPARPDFRGMPVIEQEPPEDLADPQQRGREPWMAPAPGATPEPDAAGPVPEPSTFLLLSTGIVGIAITARRRRKQTSPA